MVPKLVDSNVVTVKRCHARGSGREALPIRREKRNRRQSPRHFGSFPRHQYQANHQRIGLAGRGRTVPRSRWAQAAVVLADNRLAGCPGRRGRVENGQTSEGEASDPAVIPRRLCVYLRRMTARELMHTIRAVGATASSRGRELVPASAGSAATWAEAESDWRSSGRGARGRGLRRRGRLPRRAAARRR